MLKVAVAFLLLLNFQLFAYSQVSENDKFEGFSDSDTIALPVELTPDEVETIVLKEISKNQPVYYFAGYLHSILREQIDSSELIIKINGVTQNCQKLPNGIFYILSSTSLKSKLIDISVKNKDFHSYDTNLVITQEQPLIIDISLQPKYQILLKGRVYSGNLPVENVDVIVHQNSITYPLKTQSCFYDKDDYWNCLYNGMFKLDLRINNADDSIFIDIQKTGMVPVHEGMTLAEYSGDVLNFYLKYDTHLPKLPRNNFNFKLGFPFTSSDNDWMINISYYRLLSIGKFNRISLGAETQTIFSIVTVEHETFPGLEEANYDSTYVTFLAGPSFQLWLNRPDIRKFSTYLGLTAAINLTDFQFTPMPFIGTRYFLDMNKSVSLEARYAAYSMDIVHYNFDPFGNPGRYNVPTSFNKLMINFGIQIVF